MRNTIHISSNHNSNHNSNNGRTQCSTVREQIVQPTIRQLQRPFLFCLLLLLSICSATDSFQQFDSGDSNRRQHQQHRITRASPLQATSIANANRAPLIGIYGGDLFEPSSDFGGYQRPQQQPRRRTQKRRRRAKAALDSTEYQKRKQEWADRYTTLEGLRATFGSNCNKLYGDLDVATTRRLYQSLLPTAVCELVLDVEVKPEELAQLAFEARKAAKLYARERCRVPARVFANCYDGIRSFRRYGRFQVQGMSYDQIFDKYYQRSALERSLKNHRNTTGATSASAPRRRWFRTNRVGDERVGGDDEDWDEEDIVTQTCMKILESACRTNPVVDRMALSSSEDETNDGRRKKRMNRDDLEKIAQTLEDDVRKLLDPYHR